MMPTISTTAPATSAGVEASLKRCFTERPQWFSNRASAVFPVRIGPDVDTIISFVDYWRLKKGLKTVTCVLRVFAEDGTVALRQIVPIASAHNQISLAGLLGVESFSGMVEVEILSPENMGFRFPAVVAFYRSAEFYSAVHSAGRVRNADETYTPRISTQTNWTCDARPGVSPFFHLFNGPRDGGLGEIEIRLMTSATDVAERRRIDFGLQAPYASKLVLLDELFDLRSRTTGEYFFALDLPEAEVYPRPIVGNYHHDIDFLEATHSFYWTTNLDYLDESDPDVILPAFVPLMCPPELNLELLGYPTNAPGDIVGTIRECDSSMRLHETGREVAWKTGGEGAPIWRFAANPDVPFASIDFRRGKIPSRLNAEFRYSVRSAAPRFATDTAWGAYACHYPPRRSHWGHGIVSSGYETVIMIRNVAQRRGESADAVAHLELFGLPQERVEAAIEVPAEGAAFVRVRDLFGTPRDARFVSWLLKSQCATLDTYWLSFSPNGGICGEHGF